MRRPMLMRPSASFLPGIVTCAACGAGGPGKAASAAGAPAATAAPRRLQS